jgi:hypothetical protein
MKNKIYIFAFTILLLAPGLGLAHEHDEGHGQGAMHSDMQGTSGEKGHHGMSEGMQKIHAEHVATLREAAAALKDSHPELAAKLESMVKMHKEMHEGVES